MQSGSRGGSKSVRSSQSGKERDVAHVIFPARGEISKRRGGGKEMLHALAVLQFIVLSSALVSIAVSVSHFVFWKAF